jgi:hypothetical protein
MNRLLRLSLLGPRAAFGIQSLIDTIEIEINIKIKYARFLVNKIPPKARETEAETEEASRSDAKHGDR